MALAVLIRAVLWWVAILTMAILNGILRENCSIPSIGSFAALMTSGLILSCLIFLVSCVAVPGLGHLTAAQYWIIGFVWLVMTLIFEFGFGLFVQHKELSELLQAYSFKGGNIWPVVLASTLISPRLAERLRRVAMNPMNRLYYLDNLKVFLIFLVIIHHVGQAYGATGGAWFYAYPGERIKGLSYLFGFNASFFMGLFFFISGYFFPGSFDRHGARKFISDKLIRFGIPLIFVTLFINPVLGYAKYLHYKNAMGLPDFYIRHWLVYAHDKTQAEQTFNFSQLWFVEHLLSTPPLCCNQDGAAGTAAFPFHFPAWDVRLPAILLFIAALGFVTDLMRTSWGFPTDRWLFFLGFIQMEPAHIPQYLSLFVLGILAYRHSLLESLTSPRNMLWFIPGLGIYAITVYQRHITGRRAVFLWEYREALLCVGVCIGLLALFRTFFNRTGPVVQLLADNAYGAYIIHVAVVVALQYAFDPVQAGPFTLFVVVSILAIIGSFLGSSSSG